MSTFQTLRTLSLLPVDMRINIFYYFIVIYVYKRQLESGELT